MTQSYTSKPIAAWRLERSHHVKLHPPSDVDEMALHNLVLERVPLADAHPVGYLDLGAKRGHAV